MGDYIDLEFFQNYTQTTYDGTTTPTATFVETLIDESEDYINEETNRTWGVSTNVNELYDIPPQELLLNNYPVLSVSEIRDKNGDELTEGIDNDYVVEGNFVRFINCQARVYIDYTSGYTTVPIKVKMLAMLLTLGKVVQGGSSSSSNSKGIKVGPISITKQLGTQTVINLDKDIKEQWRQVKRLLK